MALIKIYTLDQESKSTRNSIAQTIKFIGSAVLNCPEIPTNPSNIEIVYCEGIDLAGIDYIIEIIACKRPNLQKTSDELILALNSVYPNTLFSVYFNLIEEDGMASSPRQKNTDKPLSVKEAVSISKSQTEKI